MARKVYNIQPGEYRVHITMNAFGTYDSALTFKAVDYRGETIAMRTAPNTNDAKAERRELDILKITAHHLGYEPAVGHRC